MAITRFIVRGGTEYNPETGNIRQIFRAKSKDPRPNSANPHDLLFLEDTMKLYFWDEDINDWTPMGAQQGVEK